MKSTNYNTTSSLGIDFQAIKGCVFVTCLILFSKSLNNLRKSIYNMHSFHGALELA